MVGLDPKAKQATVFNLVNVAAEAKRNMQVNQLDALRQSLREAADNPDAKVESLGEKETRRLGRAKGVSTKSSACRDRNQSARWQRAACCGLGIPPP